MPLRASVVSLLPPSPFPSLSSSVGPTSFIFDPASKTLALMLSDSSFLLFHSFSLSSSASPPPPPPTRIPPISTAAAFVRVSPNPNSAQTLFLSASPSPSSSSILLRAWTLVRPANIFSPVPLSLNNKPSQSKTLTLDLRHGFGVRIAGSVNVLAVFSAASGRIWVFGPRAVGDGRIDLVKCAVIECTNPIYEMRVERGVLVLGEVGGVRVFPLRPLMKGGSASKRKARRDGAVDEVDGGRACGKLRTLKLRQNSGEFCSFFVMIKCAMVQDSDSNIGALSSVKAVSVHILSQKKLLVLDSCGDLYLLTLQSSALASNSTAHSSMASKCVALNHLDVTMKVQMLAVLPDMSESRLLVWLSDGSHSVHVLSVADSESPVGENDNDENKEKSLQISAVQAIFTREKVQDIIPLSASAILLLGQGDVFAYSIA